MTGKRRRGRESSGAEDSKSMFLERDGDWKKVWNYLEGFDISGIDGNVGGSLEKDEKQTCSRFRMVEYSDEERT